MSTHIADQPAFPRNLGTVSGPDLWARSGVVANGTPAPQRTRQGGRPLYLVPFLPGDGREVLLTVIYIAEFPRGPGGQCAFCHGDPCAETSDEATLIGNYALRLGRSFETCPCCLGRPS